MKSGRSVKVFTAALVAAVGALVIFCAIQIPHLNTSYSVRQFFPKNHPVLEHDEKIARDFHLHETPAFLITLSLPAQQKGHWLTPSRMKSLTSVTETLASREDVKSVLSLSNLEMALPGKGTLQIGPLFETLPPSRWEKFVRANALLKPQLISNDLRSVLLVVEPDTISSTALIQMEKELRPLISKKIKGVEVGVGGVPAVQIRLSEQLQAEVGRFMVGCLILFCVLFALFYRNFSPLLFAGVGLLITNITAVGLLSKAGVAFTVLLSTLPVIVSIAFVSLTIHTLHLWTDRLDEADSNLSLSDRFRLSIKTLKEMALPNLLGSLTTAIGFLTLASVEIPVIREYALVITGSVIWTWFLTQFLFLAALPFLRPQLREWTRRKAYWTLQVTRWSLPIFAVTIVSSVLFSLAGVKMNFAGRLFDDLPQRDLARQATSFIDQKFGGSVNLHVVLEANKKDAWKNPERLRDLRKALAEIRRVSGVGSAMGLTDFFSEGVPKSSAAVAETYFLYSMSPEDPLKGFLDHQGRSTRIAIRLQDIPTDRVEKTRAKIKKVVKKHFPKDEIAESGLAVNSHTINTEVAKSLVFGFWHSLAIIGLLLLFVFRSWRWAFVACLPNLVPPAFLIGALAMTQTPVKPGVALIFSIALGLAFNNTVYFLSRLKRIRDEQGMRALPLRKTLLLEGNPCLSESLLMFAGFSIFLTSDFGLNQTFGVYMLLSIAAGALGDLVFLPALLRLYPSLLTSKPFPADASEDDHEEDAAFVEKEPEEMPSKRTAAGWIVAALSASLLLGLFGGEPALASGRVLASAKHEQDQIFAKARQNLEAKTDSATVSLKIIEANGDEKIRKLELKTLRDKQSFKAVIRLLSPADVKGTAVLAEVDSEGNQNQWLYLPSQKQVRRVVSGKKSAGVLGSELNPDDLSPDLVRHAQVKLVKKTESMALFEIKPKKGTSEFSKILSTMKMPEALPMKTVSYKGNRMAKTVEFSDYVKVGPVFRAQKIKIQNHANKRGTLVEFSDLKVNEGVRESDFTTQALKP